MNRRKTSLSNTPEFDAQDAKVHTCRSITASICRFDIIDAPIADLRSNRLKKSRNFEGAAAKGQGQRKLLKIDEKSGKVGVKNATKAQRHKAILNLGGLKMVKTKIAYKTLGRTARTVNSPNICVKRVENDDMLVINDYYCFDLRAIYKVAGDLLARKVVEVIIVPWTDRRIQKEIKKADFTD